MQSKGLSRVFSNTTLPKVIYRFNKILIKTPVAFFIEIEKAALNFVWNPKRPQTAKVILKKKREAGGIMLPDFRLYIKI